ncbi:exosporium protein C [Aneurinibacillus sp. Ricciae_BoGa-3]|uniref:exosporium protein C n=1 Tax=Aneurinibacillus sp. Ricciae_BoGa-3 TaxID=3022697 RepID=UPI0023409D8C|nr:exosporium protein C [Aneurinibacillus sp. Ricciae_BoGa-3]WCK54708.1 exosporium protein C [Aneurinibacillus sp. Ricciae_BoGa-3]
MKRIIDYKATEPRRTFNVAISTPITTSPTRLGLASLRVMIPTNSSNNTVELVATVGVRGVTGISQILFRVFRDGKQIFSTQSGIESAGSEQNYTVSFQAIDRNLAAGTHKYVLTAENRTSGTRADVVGPVSFSALVIKN